MAPGRGARRAPASPRVSSNGALLPAEAKVGDVLRVEADALVDGIEITAVLPPKGERKERFERIEVQGRPGARPAGLDDPGAPPRAWWPRRGP